MPAKVLRYSVAPMEQGGWGIYVGDPPKQLLQEGFASEAEAVRRVETTYKGHEKRPVGVSVKSAPVQ